MCRHLRVAVQAYGLPTTCPLKYLRLDELMGKMALDKKNAAGRVRVTILKSIGSSFDHPQPVDTALIRRLLSPSLLVLPPAAPPSGATLALAPSPPPGRAARLSRGPCGGHCTGDRN